MLMPQHRKDWIGALPTDRLIGDFLFGLLTLAI
jgi:hypothetical protein